MTVVQPQFSSKAAAILEITPITWNVIGLDSNRVNDGPNKFPVGARVCNTGDTPAANVESTFVWDTSDPFINLRSGSLSEFTVSNGYAVSSLANGDCYDFYYEVEITRDSNAYDNTREYHITATADGLSSVSTPTPREIYVEHIISQNRNLTVDIELDGVSIPVGGNMTLMVGETYTISLDGNTATNGYEQIESFIHFQNTIFQIVSVLTTYAADSSANVNNPNNKLYGDSCIWENDPDNPNYRSCLSTGKNGGVIRVDYTIKIIGGAGESDTLNSMIYDFSGSSYHYNSDFSASYRTFDIIGPSSVTIKKRFVPDSITSGGTSTLMVTLNNPTPTSIDGVNFLDTFPTSPANMVVAGTSNISYQGCGAGAFSPVPTGGEGSISFSGGTIGQNSSCIIKVDVTVPSDGSYVNTTNNLLINTDVDTGNSDSDTLTAGSAASCTPNQTMAVWTVPATATNPPDKSSPAAGSPTTLGAKVSSATVSATLADRTAISSILGQGDTYSWVSWGYKTPVQNIDFVLDTSTHSDVSMAFYEQTDTNGPTTLYIYYDSGSGMAAHPTTPTVTPTVGSFALHTIDFTGLTNTGGNTTFRISGSGALNDNSGANLFLDNITFTGCTEVDPPPTISKAFLESISPYADISTLVVGGTSKLTFTLNNNDAAAVALSGVKFTDDLPTGLEVASTPNASTTCLGSPTWTPGTGDTTLTFGDPTGATMAVSSSCTVSVDITATAAGQFENVSNYISSNESGENTSSSGYGTDTLAAIAPPSILKDFSPTTVLTGNTTILTFTITNPNQSQALSGVAFSDTLPAGADVTTGSSSQCGGTLTVTDNDPVADTIVLTGGSIAADDSCTFSVTVTGTTTGSKDNVTGTVTSTEGGDGNTASASFFVKDPAPKINLVKYIGLTNDPDGVWGKFLTITTLPTNVYYKFTVENIGDVELTSIKIWDPDSDFPSGTPVSCTLYKPGPVAFVEPLSVGDYVYCIVGPVAVTVPGSETNTAKASGEYSSTEYDSDPSSSATYGTPDLTIEKSVAESYFLAVDDVLNYSYEVSNTGYVPLEGPVTVADDKATDEDCPAVSTAKLISDDSDGDGDNYLDIGEYITCTASYTIVAGDVTAGSVKNTATATVDGETSDPDDVTVYLFTSPTIAKAFSPATITAGGTSTITFTLTNPNASALTGASFTDTLTDMEISGDQSAGGSCTGAGGNSFTDGDTSLSLSGITIPASDSCTVTIVVSSSVLGVQPNATSGVTTTEVPTAGAVSNTANLTVLGTPTIAKAFSPATITVGGTSTITFTLTNPNASALTGASFTDTLTDMEISGDQSAGGSCTGAGGNSFTDGDTSLSLSGITIPASDSCTVTIVVSSSVLGVQPNATSGVTTTEVPTAGTVSNTANLTVLGTPTIAKAFSPATITAGGTSTITFTLTNPNASALTGASFTDTLTDMEISGDQSAGGSCTGAGGNSFTDGDTSLSLSGITIPASDSCTVTIVVSSSVLGVQPNATSGVTTTEVPTAGPVSNTANLTVQAPDLGLTKTDGVGTVSAGGSTTYTLTITNSGSANTNGTITVVDVLPSGMSIADNVGFTPGGANGANWSCVSASDVITCTSSTAIAGGGGTSVFSFTVNVNSDATGSLVNKAKVGGGGDPTNSSLPSSGDVNSCTADDSPEGCALDTDTAQGNVFDPPFGVKTFDDDGLPLLQWTIVWINDNNLSINASVSDPIPVGASFEASGAASGTDVPVTAPPASTDVGVSCFPDPTNLVSTTTTTWCYYEGPTLPTYPRGRIIWEGTLGPDSGATDQSNANDELYITFSLRLNNGVTAVSNTATIDADLNNDTDMEDPDEQNVATASADWAAEPPSVSDYDGVTLPKTGFAPGKATFIAETKEPDYNPASTLELEVPALGIRIPIVGVPVNARGWDVDWLWDQAGWLEGTAFPTWNGNSVLTSHVYLSNGLPGPFVDLKTLKWGNEIIVHAYGYRYVYKVQSVRYLMPNDTSILDHEDKSWLTLVTCAGYNESLDSYKYRVAVQAIRVSAKAE